MTIMRTKREKSREDNCAREPSSVSQTFEKFVQRLNRRNELVFESFGHYETFHRIGFVIFDVDIHVEDCREPER